MQFTKLKITGFKSFVEPTEFPIEPGLTGVVGPNGCGKSNVVESLRWAMGENSAKRLRGSEMDDVIFSGSAGRPARNLAEVSLLLDNRERTALAEFNADDELEITRHIERGMGSDYRINGRPVRQKDVQLLFADQATGAHSTSIVSQGRVAALIAAKPEERRQVLEEAAGVSGLHARRHEAELKLKAAETNLARVADQLQVMDQQLRGLKTQVRQTSRYRNLGELIRKAEAGLLYLKSREAASALETANESFRLSESKVQELTSIVAQASAKVAESAALLPPLRQNEAAASAIVQRLFLERETLEREAKRVAEAQTAALRRINEVKADTQREQELVREAESSLADLAKTKTEAENLCRTLEAEAPGLAAKAKAAREALNKEEQVFQEQTTHFAEMAARRGAIQREEENLKTRAAVLVEKITSAETDVGALQKEASSLDPGFYQALAHTAEKTLNEKQAELARAQNARRDVEAMLSTARAARDGALAEKARIEAEIEALRALLAAGEDEAATPVSHRTVAKEGFETALAAALGEGFFAPIDSESKTFWQDLGSVGFMGPPALPRGAEPLLPQIDAPPELKRALSFAGLVQNEEEGDRLSRELKPGQILVSRAGGLWRWDGYTQRENAETPSVLRARQHTRLKAAEKAAQAQSPQLTEAEDNLLTSEKECHEAIELADRLTAETQTTFTALNTARQKHAEVMGQRGEVEARLSAAAENLATLRIDQNAAQETLAKLAGEQQTLPAAAELEKGLEAARNRVAKQRAVLIEAEAAEAGFEASLESARARLKSAGEAEVSWRARVETGLRHIEALAARLKTLETEATELTSRPAAMEEERQALLTKSTAAEKARTAAADALLQAEQKQAALEKEMRSSEEALMQAKETRVRSEEQMYRAKGAHDEIALRIREHWHGTPEELPEKAGLEVEGKDAPTLPQLEHDLARFNRERENMGPVNLRAEMEAGEIEAAMDKITADKSDLEGAIAKLRQGISALNREARERLSTAFTEVDKNFTALFERLFGGGRAYLKLIESDDPLEAGLEIYASPPGKRLQVMSLLSGGEQALTALSLLFAIFLVNPSPICVLDEVDAPLDEANVDRFCTLVREMAESGKTRFIVVTHHRLTMARMDRLFGVTMAEKGVSQLVSVDLKQALALREQGGEQPESYGDVAAAE